MSKSKKRKGKDIIRPEDYFRQGPLEFARFGKNTIGRATWKDDEYQEFQRECIERYPIIVKEIDELVQQIANLVAMLPPEKVLSIAWWKMALQHTSIKAEVDVTSDHGISMRMIDYIQSIVASVTPATNAKDDVTEEDWDLLRSNIELLFAKLNSEYPICRTLYVKKENKDYNEFIEEFLYRAQFYWCNVGGCQFQIHQIQAITDLLLPHNDVFYRVFGITVDYFIQELAKIWHNLTFIDTQEPKEFQHTIMDALEHRTVTDKSFSQLSLPDQIAEVLKDDALKMKEKSLFGRLFGMDLFDLEKVTNLPHSLLDELAWSQGEEDAFFAEGEFKGWPLRVWPIFKRPFIKINERYYCFSLHDLFDNLYRVLQRSIIRSNPAYRETWNAIQKETSETLPFNYLLKLLPEAQVYKDIHYRGQVGEGHRRDWCQTDGLILFDDHLIVLEIKAGAFTPTSPITDLFAYIDSLKNLILEPTTQGKRFFEFLTSEDEVTLYNAQHDPLTKIKKSDFRHIIICTVTLDSFTEFAAQAQHLRKLGIDLGREPIWNVSIDDLRVYADLFENPLLFLHYIEQRQKAFNSPTLDLDDELDHLGLYLEHNDYSQYAKEMSNNNQQKIRFHGYRANIDVYFGERLHSNNLPNPLIQKMPARMKEIIDLVVTSRKIGRSRLASSLLDLGGKTRKQIFNSIDKMLDIQNEKSRIHPISTHKGFNITIFAWEGNKLTRDATYALKHTKTVMVLNKDEDRLLLELTYDETRHLVSLDWQWLSSSSFTQGELSTLKISADALRKNRLVKANQMRGKIGRNQLCPCGSGDKFKKCCLLLNI